MGRLSQMLIASTGGYTSSFLIATGLLIVGAALTFTLEGKKAKKPVIQRSQYLEGSLERYASE